MLDETVGDGFANRLFTGAVAAVAEGTGADVLAPNRLPGPPGPNKLVVTGALPGVAPS